MSVTLPAPVLPGWLDLPPGGMTAEDYENLPEEICRRIEIVDGNVATDTTGTSKISVTAPFAFTVELADLTW